MWHFFYSFCNCITTKKVRFGGPLYDLMKFYFYYKGLAVVHLFLMRNMLSCNVISTKKVRFWWTFLHLWSNDFISTKKVRYKLISFAFN